MMSFEFTIEKNQNPKTKPDPDKLGFGNHFSDHMFLMNYKTGKGWYDGRIVPYQPLCLDPAAAVFHYAQEMFEGLKAYRAADGRTLLFRPDMNAKRTRRTNERMCIPDLDEDLQVAAIKALVAVEKDWVPEADGTSLYLRPFIIASEPFLGVRPSDEFLYVIIASPSGSYYENGLAPTRIFVEDEYVRAAPGGTGYAKVGGNYAGALKAQEKAHDKGCSQVLWLDGVERRYVEEIGTSNAFFMIGDEIITAPLDGTILPGITRDSVLTLLRHWGMKVTERKLLLSEIFQAHETGNLTEVFATGTAAVISPVGELIWKDKSVTINNNEIGALSQKLYDEIYGIQTGKKEDPFGWVVEI